ncbi:MAG: LacI family transcriptional regulator [Clostridiaceae bacterium]|nr:LacI family transcriptional regulator [Clostridiaceae bacterium]
MNIYDIAREANVSIATVSRVLNDSGRVRDITRQKVEAVLKKYNYVPSAIARGMMTNSLKTIGIVAIDIRNLYYANVAHSIEQSLSVLGFNTILCNTGYDTEQKIKYLRMLVEKKVDSIILVGSPFKDPSLDKPIEQISKNTPIIIVNGHYEYPNIYSVQCNDRSALKRSVDYLVSKGRKSFLYLYDAETFSGRQKLLGFMDAVSKHQVKSEVFLVKPGLEPAYEKIQELVSSGLDFDAVLTSEDFTAIGVLKCLAANNIRVPEDVSVMGFNNSVLSVCCTPALSTVDSKMEEMGRVAVKVLHKVLKGEKAETSTVIDADLIFRETT